MRELLNKTELQKVKDVRALLHQNPEKSEEESVTKSIIRSFIVENTDLSVETYGNGLLATYSPENETNAPIAFRADFDAVSLPGGGAAHLCGHDGHTAALLGMTLVLQKLKPSRKVYLIFQAAEENGEGAKTMAPLLKEKQIKEIYGCHNLPGFTFGKVFTKEGTFACASCGLTLRFSGKPAHAAYPEDGLSPYKAVADILNLVSGIASNERYDFGTFATIIGCDMGQKAFGTSAEKAELWLTLRSRTQAQFLRLKEDVLECAQSSAYRDGLMFMYEEQDAFPATENDDECVQKILKRTVSSVLKEPMRWSEDFGHYLLSGKGGFFGIGAGPIADLHTENYEYPDELLKYQMDAFTVLL